MADLRLANAAVPYQVQAPDGSVVEFHGPPGMSDDQIVMRAQQEYGVKTGSIPTTFSGGVQQSVGDTLADHSSALGTAIGLGGVVAGMPPVVAAAPAIGRAIKAGGQYIAGRKIETPSVPEMGVLAAEGAFAGYGPEVLGAFAKSTVPHVSPLTGQYIKGISGSGVPAWAGRTAGEAAHAMTGPGWRAAALAVPDQIRQYLMDRLNSQSQP